MKNHCPTAHIVVLKELGAQLSGRFLMSIYKSDKQHYTQARTQAGMHSHKHTHTHKLEYFIIYFLFVK